MNKQVEDMIVCGDARLVDAPVRYQIEADRNFGLPTALFGAMAGCYFGFLGLMASACGNSGLAIPMVIFAVAIIAGFAVPANWGG